MWICGSTEDMLLSITGHSTIVSSLPLWVDSVVPRDEDLDPLGETVNNST